MSVHLAAARAMLSRHPLVDGHNDLPWSIRTRFGPDLGRLDLAAPEAGTHTDLPRLRRGGGGGQFWSVYVPGTLRGDAAGAPTLEQVDLVPRMGRCHPDGPELALRARDVGLAFSRGRTPSPLGAGGGPPHPNARGGLP